MPRRPRSPTKVDISLLSDDEKLLILQEAQEQVDKEAKKAARDAYLAAAIADIKKQPIEADDEDDEETVNCYIDLAEHSDRIILDGFAYFFGRTYRVSVAKYDTLREIMAKGFDHQQEIDGKSRFSNVARNTRLSPNGAVGNILRV